MNISVFFDVYYTNPFIFSNFTKLLNIGIRKKENNNIIKIK